MHLGMLYAERKVSSVVAWGTTYTRHECRRTSCKTASVYDMAALSDKVIGLQSCSPRMLSISVWTFACKLNMYHTVNFQLNLNSYLDIRVLDHVEQSKEKHRWGCLTTCPKEISEWPLQVGDSSLPVKAGLTFPKKSTKFQSTCMKIKPAFLYLVRPIFFK